MKALSLMYHDVVEHGTEESSGFAGPAAAEYKLEREEFAKHLDAIELALPGTTVPDDRARRPMRGAASGVSDV